MLTTEARKDKINKQARSPLKVSLRAFAGTGRHRHRVCFPHHTSGCGFQFPVDSFHSHEARLTLGAQFQDKEQRGDREQSGTLSSLATINNLAAATSRVCRVTLRLGGSAAWLQLFVFRCWANIYSLVLWVTPSLSAANCQNGECTILEEGFVWDI